MLRKKQITSPEGQVITAPHVAGMRKERARIDSAASASFEFDESLHTVDSIKVHMRHVHQPLEEQCDLSVFSESFASTDTYILSDYEEDEDDKLDEDMKEAEDDEEDDDDDDDDL